MAGSEPACGIPAGDLPAVFAAPALLAAGPALYSWKLSRNFVQQFGMQLTAMARAGLQKG